MTGQPISQTEATSGLVQVELFGVPRLVAGQRSLRVAGATLAELVAALEAACPALVGRVIADGWLLDGYTFVVNERFTTDRDQAIDPDSSVLLVSSVAGG